MATTTRRTSGHQSTEHSTGRWVLGIVEIVVLLVILGVPLLTVAAVLRLDALNEAPG